MNKKSNERVLIEGKIPSANDPQSVTIITANFWKLIVICNLWWLNSRPALLIYTQKLKNQHILNIGVWIIYMVEQCHKSCQQTVMIGLKILLDFIKTSWKAIMKKVTKGIFFEVDVQYPEKLHEVHNNLPFLPEKEKLKT